MQTRHDRCWTNGERGRNRTFNLLIKSQLLCQLSYAPTVGIWLVGRTKIIASIDAFSLGAKRSAGGAVLVVILDKRSTSVLCAVKDLGESRDAARARDFHLISRMRRFTQ